MNASLLLPAWCYLQYTTTYTILYLNCNFSIPDHYYSLRGSPSAYTPEQHNML